MTTIVGTVPYMAPEAATSQYTEKVDIYSAAVTFYELFEQATFDPEMPFAWAMAPDKVKSIIKMMGDTDPRCRPVSACKHRSVRGHGPEAYNERDAFALHLELKSRASLPFDRACEHLEYVGLLEYVGT